MVDYIQRGIKYVYSQQLSTGSFCTYVSRSCTDFKESNAIQTTFIPSLISSALENVCDTDALRKNIRNYLLTQRQSDHSFNYWDNTQPEYTSQPYPNDLDDTFCALGAIGLPINGSQQAAITKLLMHAEQQPGGPYRTWLSDDRERWSNVDPVVNANIACYVARLGVELPNITEYIEHLIQSNQLKSTYYFNKSVIYYFITRYYKGSCSNQIIEELLDFDHEPLYIAMSITAALRSGCSKEWVAPLIHQLATSQNDDGSWPATGFYLHAQSNDTLIYAGSATLTTAICLEALSLYNSQAPPDTDSQYEHPVIKEINQTIEQIKSRELRASLKELVRAADMTNYNRHVVDMPELMTKALNTQVDAVLLYNLTLLSAWGWIAYGAQDDIIDDERSSKYLPALNFCMRQVASIINTFDPKFKNDAHTILTRIDIANAWELAQCRDSTPHNIPDYSNYWQLADRSLGHMLAGLGILYSRHTTIAVVRSFKIFFRHYLIARQLNDDAHDWEDDLARGHINAVAARLLTVQRGSNVNVETLRTLLWEKEIIQINKLILSHTNQARHAIMQQKKQFNVSTFEQLLRPIEDAVHKSEVERIRTLEFIAAL